MSAADDVRAVHARPDLSVDERHQAAHRIKAVAHRDALAPLVGRPVTIDGCEITLTRLPQYDTANDWLYVWCEITKAGQPVPLDLPIMVRNPPLFAPTGPNGEMREDVRGAALRVLRGLVR